MKKAVIQVLVLVFALSLFAATTPEERFQSFSRHTAMQAESPFRALEWRSVGPYFMGGRICDIAGWASDPHRILVAAASGGLWLTENRGTTWTPLFENQPAVGFGDIAVSEKDNNLIWAGTGEENSSRSSYAGTGVYKSTDGGKSWTHMGLADTQHIGEVLIHPENTDIVYVAAIGRLYTENEERGVFKTTDGGKTWEKILYVSPRTGVIDLAMHPKNPEILLAAAWERDRKAWHFTGSGEESAIFKTTDGGKTWRKVVEGFPQGEHVGRIGLRFGRSNPDVVYAFHDNQAPRPAARRPGEGRAADLTAESLKTMEVEAFLKIEDARLESLLRSSGAPRVFTAKAVKEAVRNGEITLPDLADILIGGANAALFAAQVKGAEVYRSDDGGESWKRTHEEDLPAGIVHTYGYYFGKMAVDPKDENTIYILGVPAMKSTDGGRTFKEIPDVGGSYGTGLFDVHPDHHALWIDPNDPDVLWLGNDGGLNVSYDAGRTFQKINNIPLAQCYTVAFDMQTPYNIYTGLQDNGVNRGPGDFVFGRRDKQWRMILGGDGAFVQPDLQDPDTVYAAFQFGSIFRLNLAEEGRGRSIRPDLKTVQPPYRFNWLTPFMISRHNPYTLILGANKILKSVDRGDNWIEISPDLTDRKNIDGNVPFATITALDESPLTPEVIYAGTDDGNVWVTKNMGKSWDSIIEGLPKKWVTRIEASRFAPERVYLSMIGYREDDFRTYVFSSEDYGATWTSIKGNLPEEGVNVIREDLENENVLYLGTDLTAYVSLDRGRTWHSLRCNLPVQAVYDMRIHPREKDLIIGTHGRGVFVMSVEKIQKLTSEVLKKEAHLYPIQETRIVPQYFGAPGGARIEFWASAAGPATIMVKDQAGALVKSLNIQAVKGMNILEWDLIPEGSKAPVKPGEYAVELRVGKTVERGALKVTAFQFTR
jgi:photosystem II stability/assembly factor-like uncharacterized protein